MGPEGFPNIGAEKKNTNEEREKEASDAETLEETSSEEASHEKEEAPEPAGEDTEHKESGLRSQYEAALSRMSEKEASPEAGEEREKTTAEQLEETRSSLAKEYAGLKEKTLGIFGSELVEDEDKAQDVANIENAYRDTLKKYRQEAVHDSTKTAEDVVTETVAKEATAFDELKTEYRAEKHKGTYYEKAWSGAKKAVEKYKKLPGRYKIGASVVLAGGAMTAGSASAAALAGVSTAAVAQRGFAGASAAMGLEGFAKRWQEKREQKEVKKQVGEDALTYLKNDNAQLDKKLFELEGKKKRKRYGRFAAAGTAGALIGTGTVGKAIGSLAEYVPSSWMGTGEAQAEGTDTRGGKERVLEGERPPKEAYENEAPSYVESKEPPETLTPEEAPEALTPKEAPEETAKEIDSRSSEESVHAPSEERSSRPESQGSDTSSETTTAEAAESSPSEAAEASPSPEVSEAAQEVNEKAQNIRELIKMDATVTIEQGDSVWNAIEGKLTKSGVLEGMSEGEQTHIIDALKDKVAAMSEKELKEIGIESGDVKTVHPGDTVDLSAVLNDRETIEKALAEANNLSEAEIAQIESYEPSSSETAESSKAAAESIMRGESFEIGSTGEIVDDAYEQAETKVRADIERIFQGNEWSMVETIDAHSAHIGDTWAYESIGKDTLTKVENYVGDVVSETGVNPQAGESVSEYLTRAYAQDWLSEHHPNAEINLMSAGEAGGEAVQDTQTAEATAAAAEQGADAQPRTFAEYDPHIQEHARTTLFEDLQNQLPEETATSHSTHWDETEMKVGEAGVKSDVWQKMHDKGAYHFFGDSYEHFQNTVAEDMGIDKDRAHALHRYLTHLSEWSDTTPRGDETLEHYALRANAERMAEIHAEEGGAEPQKATAAPESGNAAPPQEGGGQDRTFAYAGPEEDAGTERAPSPEGGAENVRSFNEYPQEVQNDAYQKYEAHLNELFEQVPGIGSEWQEWGQGERSMSEFFDEMEGKENMSKSEQAMYGYFNAVRTESGLTPQPGESMNDFALRAWAERYETSVGENIAQSPEAEPEQPAHQGQERMPEQGGAGGEAEQRYASEARAYAERELHEAVQREFDSVHSAKWQMVRGMDAASLQFANTSEVENVIEGVFGRDMGIPRGGISEIGKDTLEDTQQLLERVYRHTDVPAQQGETVEQYIYRAFATEKMEQIERYS